MTLRQLRYFVAVVDAGLNITLAAERVHATQPGISKQLKQLEGLFGFTLFRRKGKSLEALTAEGAQLLTRAREVVDGAQAIRALASELKGEQGLSLRIGASTTFAHHVLPPLLARLRQRFADLKVDLRTVQPAEALEALRRGALDLAIFSTVVSAPPPPPAVVLSRWRRIALVPAGHRWATQTTPLSLQQLASQPIVTYDTARSPTSSLMRAFQAQGLDGRITLATSDAELIKTYVKQGLGVGILAPLAFDPAQDSGLLALEIDDALDECATWLLWPSGVALKRGARALVEALGVNTALLEE